MNSAEFGADFGGPASLVSLPGKSGEPGSRRAAQVSLGKEFRVQAWGAWGLGWIQILQTRNHKLGLEET